MNKNIQIGITDCDGKRLKNSFRLILLFFFVFESITLLQAEEIDKSVLKDAAVLLQKKSPQSAYRLLEKYEDEYAGWWEYDYLLGVAALESGKSNLAIFALQRSLAMNPSLMGAHVDLGRAYYEVNELGPAKTEFEIVLENQPIKRVEKVAKNYLRLIESKSNPVRISFRYFLESKGGYDSNANSATEAKTFNGFTLSDDNVKTPSTYMSLKVGTSMNMKLNKKNAFSLAASFLQRDNQNISSVNFINRNAQISWKYRHKYAEQTLGVQTSNTNVSESFQTNATTLNFAMKFRLIVDAYFGVNGSFTNISFDEPLSEKNSIQTMVGSTLSRKGKKPMEPSTSFSVFVGENTPTARIKSNGKFLRGARVGVQYRVLKRSPIMLNFSSGVLRSVYKEKYFTKERVDLSTDVSLSGVFRLSKSWEISLKVSATKNKSTIELYQYVRANSALGIKRYF